MAGRQGGFSGRLDSETPWRVSMPRMGKQNHHGRLGS